MKSIRQLILIILFTCPALTSAGQIYCNFGGWPSLYNASVKNCLPPYDKKVQMSRDPFLTSLAPKYSSEFNCGGKDLFRCNPTVFGQGAATQANAGKGHCVVVFGPTPESVAKACVTAAQPMSTNHAEVLKSNQNLLIHFLSNATETTRFCNETNALGCPTLLAYYQDIIKVVLSNRTVDGNCDDLYCKLPAILNTANETAFDQVTSNLLLDGYKKYWETKNAATKLKIQAYSQSKSVSNMLTAITNNSTKATMPSGACQPSYPAPNKKQNKKAAKKSTESCYRYIKHALCASGITGGSYTGDKYAINAKDTLKQFGMVNLLEIPGFNELTPETAPVGAILIYRNTQSSNGTPGHIEVKMKDGNYGSDHINDVPISDYMDTRELAAIMVKLK